MLPDVKITINPDTTLAEIKAKIAAYETLFGVYPNILIKDNWHICIDIGINQYDVFSYTSIPVNKYITIKIDNETLRIFLVENWGIIYGDYDVNDEIILSDPAYF